MSSNKERFKKWLVHMMKYYSVFKTVAGLFINVARDPQLNTWWKENKQTNQPGSCLYKIITFYQNMSRRIYRRYFWMWGCGCHLAFLFFTFLHNCLLLMRIGSACRWASLSLAFFIPLFAPSECRIAAASTKQKTSDLSPWEEDRYRPDKGIFTFLPKSHTNGYD